MAFGDAADDEALRAAWPANALADPRPLHAAEAALRQLSTRTQRHVLKLRASLKRLEHEVCVRAWACGRVGVWAHTASRATNICRILT